MDPIVTWLVTSTIDKNTKIILAHFQPNTVTVLVLNPFEPSAAFDIETNHSIYSANQRTGCYMKCNAELKWVKKVLQLKIY